MAPSKIAEDTSIWTSSRGAGRGAERTLELAAGLTNGQYVFTERPNVSAPARTGDARHFIQLRQLDTREDWMWVTEVDHNIGAIPPARAADVFRALFASGERPAAAIRADYRAAFPRTAQVMGHLFTIDSINTTPQADGSGLYCGDALRLSYRRGHDRRA